MLDAHERFVASGPLRIWTDRVGDPELPAVLMVMGSAAQGVSCPNALVGRLVERGVQVIRFDHRDTGSYSDSSLGLGDYNGLKKHYGS
jgi:alpha-beta hydrolase superfamily lysophospholipase